MSYYKAVVSNPRAEDRYRYMDQMVPGRKESIVIRVVGRLVVRASDSRPDGLRSMPDATKYPLSTHGVRAR
ncbi:hypothetical protein TNCV_1961001 [Trichonephila clavipes]|nr:hypothetical protein TNCV_1961001 [Trichonephila clavipes]